MVGPVARGEVGQVWRLTTSGGEWAVKETFEPPPLGEVDDHAAFQELVAATGVRVPIVRRTPAGAVMADVHGVLVRVYSWVDVMAPDPRVDPIIVGQAPCRTRCHRHARRVPTRDGLLRRSAPAHARRARFCEHSTIGVNVLTVERDGLAGEQAGRHVDDLDETIHAFARCRISP